MALKSKGTLTGTIIDETDRAVVLDMGFGSTVILKDDIAEIELISEELIRKAPYGTANKKKAEQAWRARIERAKKIKTDLMEKRRKETEHKIKFQDPDSIIAEVTIDGKVTANLVVDTGAALVWISPETAEKAGYTNTENLRKIDLMLADGSKTKGTMITLKSVEVAGLKAENVNAVISERGEAKHGLLGMSFLNRFNVHIDAEKKELVLKEL